MTLGQRISTYRKKLGISQEELGARLGVSRQAVSKWETGAASPDMENLLALAREFGVSVAELSGTPQPRTAQAFWRRKRFWVPALRVLLAAAGVGLFILAQMRTPVPKPESQQPTASKISDDALAVSDFALVWTNSDGREEFLELGAQEYFFPFGTTLELTEPETVMDTDFDTMTHHRADCGAIKIAYNHIGADWALDAESPEREVITCLSTISKSVRTPQNIGVGSAKDAVLAAYGDDLVYCLKEEGGYTLVQHDYYYAYQTPETYGASLRIFMRDGTVTGLRVEDMAEEGNEAFLPDHIRRFPLVNGEPDFSQREERSDTLQVYHAWNELVTNNDLSAEEVYTDRWTVFSTLSDMDWQELNQFGTEGYPGQTIEALMSWLEKQAPYSEAETFRLQMGCTAKGLDGAYTDMYCHLLSTAFFGNPIAFAKGLACDSTEDTKPSASPPTTRSCIQWS